MILQSQGNMCPERGIMSQKGYDLPEWPKILRLLGKLTGDKRGKGSHRDHLGCGRCPERTMKPLKKGSKGFLKWFGKSSYSTNCSVDAVVKPASEINIFPRVGFGKTLTLKMKRKNINTINQVMVNHFSQNQGRLFIIRCCSVVARGICNFNQNSYW